MIGIQILEKNKNPQKLLKKLPQDKGTEQATKTIKKSLIKAQLRREILMILMTNLGIQSFRN